MIPVKPISILLVEDDPGDVVLVREAFEHNKVRNELRVASDGVYALEVLRDQSIPLPDLILLDLNLPRMDGRELLSEIRANPRLTRIPVVVLTTSDAEADIAATSCTPTPTSPSRSICSASSRWCARSTTSSSPWSSCRDAPTALSR